MCGGWVLLKGWALNVALEHGLALDCQALIKSKVEGMIHTCLFTSESPHNWIATETY